MIPRPRLDIRVTFDPIGTVPDRDYLPEFLHDCVDYGLRRVVADRTSHPVSDSVIGVARVVEDVILALCEHDDDDEEDDP